MINFQALCYDIDAPEPHRLRVQLYTAPGRASAAYHGMTRAGLRCHVEAHNILTMDNAEAVHGFLTGVGQSLLMEQALEEYLAASKLTSQGRKCLPEERARQEQAVRAVLALWAPTPMPRGQPRKGRRWRRKRPV